MRMEEDLTTEPADEASAVARAKQRDSTIWAAWHDAYYPVIYRYALVRLSRAEDAEDVASQVFLEALKSIDRFTYQGRPIIAWFYGIARHLVSKRRRQLSHSSVPLESEPDVATEEENANVERVMVWAALEKLKDEHRDVLVLRYLLDLPSTEVARIMGKSEYATYSLQVRALQAARRVLTPKTDDRASDDTAWSRSA